MCQVGTESPPPGGAAGRKGEGSGQGGGSRGTDEGEGTPSLQARTRHAVPKRPAWGSEERGEQT
ncbi:unnamed protein product [marine sediment metagenome]|uniref:Uncharacterized protein n=1 Tax=marine sediment metagenome TaxID=412755 RepID=X1SNP4_9ZZZZ